MHYPQTLTAHPAINFIKHFRTVHDRLIDDDRITAQHMSLYFALFRSWNRCRFRTPMPIIREDLMREARIGSLKTYTSRIYELYEWDYLRYEPSFGIASAKPKSFTTTTAPSVGS